MRNRVVVQRLKLVLGLVLRLVAIVGATALAAIPIVIFVDTATSTIQVLPVGFGHTRSVSASHSASVSATQNQDCSANQSMVVVVDLHQVDVSNGTLSANLSMCLGQSLAGAIVRGGRRTASGVPLLTVGGVGSTFNQPLFPVARQQAGYSVLQPLGSVTVPLDGNPRRYPLDQYGATLPVSVSGSCALGAPTIQVVADPGAANLDWSQSSALTSTGSAVGVAKGQQPICSSAAYPVAVTGHRPMTTKLFVLALVAIPLLLIAMLSLRLTEGTPRSIDGLVGVTAIMLAILPIRAVLVPGDITTLTLVDFALATEMALLATGAVWWFVLPRRRRQAASVS